MAWTRRLHPVELALPALVAVLGLGEIWVPFSSRQGEGSDLTGSVAVLLVALSLAWCRRRPLVPVLAVPVVWGLAALAGPSYVLFYGQMVPLLVGVFMAARYVRGRERWAAAGVAAGTLLLIDLTVPQLQAPGEIAFHWTVTVLVWGAGAGLRTWEKRARESTRRAVEAEVAAAEQAMRAVLEERTRIARELHDIVAHSVSSMVVQAGAAEQADDDREFVRRALSGIRSTGTDALAEMRRLVTMLRDDEEQPSLAPQPRLASLRSLVEQAATGGLATSLTVHGEERDLPAGLDLAAFRIVQEALTNVRRHAAASRCDVTLGYAPSSITLEVCDDGVGPGDGAAAGGHGLIGMRERAALYGGRLETGPGPGGGFVVRACLPVAGP